MKIRHQFNQFGRHRLVVDDVIGDWCMYEHVAECNGFIALTQYYGEKERVFQVTQLPYLEPETGVFPADSPKGARAMGSWDPR
jgi:hypothetical protein